MEHKHRNAKKGQTNLEENNDFFEEVTNFEGTDNLEETTFEPTGGFQKKFQQQFKKPHKMPDPIRIDVDGDQVAELEVTFSRVDDEHMKVNVLYLPNQQSEELVFDYTGEFSIVHQDPSDGKTPYKFHFFVHDYSKVFYATEKQWHTPTQEEIEAKKLWEKIRPGTDCLQSQNYTKLEFKNFLSIQFQEQDGLYSYKIGHYTQAGLKSSKTLRLFSHEFSSFRPGNRENGEQLQRGIVRDETAKRDANKQKKDAKVSSYTIPIEVGKIGNPGTKGDHNKYQHTLTIQKSPEDNGLAAISMSGWSGTRVAPIPGKFAEVKRAVVTEKANHLELFFEGKKYNTTWRIYQQYLMLNEKNSVGSKDEIYSLNVYVDPLPENYWNVLGDSGGYFGQKLVAYKIQHINGERLPYHNAPDNKTDKDEFHQKATEDARAKIDAQPSSSSQEEELMNIRLKETQMIGATLKGKDFSNGRGELISGDQVFMDYLSMVVAIYRVRRILKTKNKTKDIEILAMLKNAKDKANAFWLGAFHVLRSAFPQYEDFQKPSKNRGKIMLDMPSHHQKPEGIVSLKLHLKDIAKYIEAYDWKSIDSALDMFHTLLEIYSFRDKKKEVEKVYAAKAKKDAEMKAKGKKVTAEDIADARKENEREEVSVIDGIYSNYNLDNRYHAFVKDKKPPAEVYRAKVMFYPEHLNVGENKKPTYIDVPLYYYKKDGYWHIVSLVNKNAGKLFSAVQHAVKTGETHPPDEAFASLDRADHLPQGLLYYKTHDGHSNQVNIKSKTHWTTYVGYVALVLFVLGLLAVTAGAAGAAGATAASGKLFLAGGLVGAVGATGSIIDKAQRGSTTLKSITVDILDILGALIGLTKFMAGARWLRNINAAQQMGFKALNSRYAYLALETLDIGVDTTMVLIGTHDGLAQIMSVLYGPGTIGQKMSDLKFVLPMVAMQYGIFAMSLPNRVLGAMDVYKKKIIDGLPKPKGGDLPSQPKGKGENNTVENAKPTDELDPKKYPALSELRSNATIFSKATIDLVAGLMGGHQLLEPLAKAIRKMDQAHLKALCARFNEKDVLYALHYFNGDFNKAANHLGKYHVTFKDHGAKVYDVVYNYENAKTQYESFTLHKQASGKLKQVNKKLPNAKKAQKNEAKQWELTQLRLKELEAQQKTTKGKLDALPKKLKETEQALASNEAQAESFGKLTKDRKNLDKQGIDEWQQGQKAKLDQANDALTKLRDKQDELSGDLMKEQSVFLSKQRKEYVEFMSSTSQEKIKALKNGTIDQYEKAWQKRYDALQKRQDREREVFDQAQDQRREQLRNTREQTNRQEAKVGLEGKQSQRYAEAAAVLKKGIELRRQLKQLRDERQLLLKQLQTTEQQIGQLRNSLITQRGSEARIEDQIREQTAQRNQQEAAIVQKDVEIAKLEKQLAEFALQENRYSLHIRDKVYAHELNEARIKELLEQNVAPKDLDQLTEFVKVQKKQVQMRAIETKEAEQVRDAKKTDVDELTTQELKLTNEQKRLENITKQLESNEISVPKGKGGKKRRNKKKSFKKEQSKQARKAHAKQRLAAIPTELAETQDKLRRANNALESAKAKASEAESKHSQEQAKLDVYKEFQGLQKNILDNKEQLRNSRAAFDKLRKELDKTLKARQDTKTEIDLYRKPIKEKLDEEVKDLTQQQATAIDQQKRAQHHDSKQKYQDVEQKYQEAKQVYDAFVKQQAVIDAQVAVQVARANKLARALQAVKAGVKAITTGAKPPVVKAWWKVAKISKKLLNIHDKNEALHQAQAYALLECVQLETLLTRCMPNPNDSLPNDEAQLWRLLISTLENTGGHSYRSHDWKSLQDALKDIYDANKKLKAMDAEVAQASQYLEALKAQKKSVYMPTLETKTDEEVKALLEWIKKQTHKKE